MDAFTGGKFAGWFEALDYIEGYLDEHGLMVDIFNLVKQMRSAGPASAGILAAGSSASAATDTPPQGASAKQLEKAVLDYPYGLDASAFEPGTDMWDLAIQVNWKLGLGK